MEHGDAERRCIFHLVYELLIPDGIECFLFDTGAIWMEGEKRET